MDGDFGNDVRIETVAQVNRVDVVATQQVRLANSGKKKQGRRQWA